MAGGWTTGLLGRTFRSHPALELISFERLAETRQAEIRAQHEAGDLYGVLRKRGGEEMQAVCTQTALLFLTLRTPGPIPSYLERTLSDDLERAISELVLEGILEVEAAGEFLSGPEVVDPVDELPGTESRITLLSNDALRYGQDFDGLGARELSARLYAYNTAPFRRPPWDPAPGAAEDIAKQLRLDRLARHEPEAWFLSDDQHWFVFPPREADAPASDVGTFKLYVSPVETALALEVVYASHIELGHAFKVAATTHGLLRPDKLVLYFDSRAALDGASERLLSRLDGFSAQGVPFTGAIDDDGLVSWGLDPPTRDPFDTWSEGGSWRGLICDMAARALIRARSVSSLHARSANVEPWQFARERLRAFGVDTNRWAPRDDLWNVASSLDTI